MNQSTAILVGLAVAAFTSCATAPAEVAPIEHPAMPTEQLEAYECGSIKKIHRLGGIFLASQPTPDDFEQAKLDGVRTVINLRRDGEIQDFDEPEVVTALGLDYISLPFGSPDELTDETFAKARHLLNTAEQPILLHCGSANRVGALWLPWRVLDGGLSYEDALAEAKTVGLRSPALEAKARDYVERTNR